MSRYGEIYDVIDENTEQIMHETHFHFWWCGFHPDFVSCCLIMTNKILSLHAREHWCETTTMKDSCCLINVHFPCTIQGPHICGGRRGTGLLWGDVTWHVMDNMTFDMTWHVTWHDMSHDVTWHVIWHVTSYVTCDVTWQYMTSHVTLHVICNMAWNITWQVIWQFTWHDISHVT